MLALAGELNSAAESAGIPPPFDFPAIASGINFERLARAFPECWSCFLHRREPRPEPTRPEEGGPPPIEPEGKPEEPVPRKSPLRGARQMQRRMTEMFLSDVSVRAIKRDLDERAIELGWPKGEVPNAKSLWAHFHNHFPVQQSVSRMIVERDARAEGVDKVADNLGTMRSFVDRVMLGASRYLNTDYEVTSPQELALMVRLADEFAQKLVARGDAQRQQANIVDILLELRKIMPAHHFNELMNRFWDGRGGPPPSEWREALALPPGPEMSEEIPPPPETERTRAADRLAEMEKKWIQEWDGGHERARPAWHGQG